ncbi:Menaquinone-specific isochorismate synthase [hydrothermal vent metagenome]|uniref:isochorismate synthase n=1 Tax=hydrothermal vent metagenome TaxID=652676 RepID=A0A3B0SVU5_9ZZZZ
MPERCCDPVPLNTVLIPYDDIRALRTALAGDSATTRTVVIPTSVPPLQLVRSGAHLFGRAFFFSEPGGIEFGGLGATWRTVASGPGRFSILEDEFAAASLPRGVRAAVGFSFSEDGPKSDLWEGFGAAEVCVPEVAISTSVGGGYELRVTVAGGQSADNILSVLSDLAEPGRLRPPEPGNHTVEARPSTLDWQREVDDAVDAIRSGVVHKVVLSRSVVVKSEVPVPPFDLVHHLGTGHRGCYIFGWQVGDAVFLGATPELLLAKRGRSIVSNPLAGSARRGVSDEADQGIGAELMASTKDRSEHAFVVDDIRDRLGAITDELVAPSEPSVLRTAAVQHLSTRIHGTLSDGVSLYDVAATIYPTAAVGGSPRQQAQVFIDKVERLDRGWYTGGIGWTDASGDGTLALGLRCGLVRANEAHVFAGNGIVAESDAERELLETRLKLRPMLNLLSAT